MEQQNKAASPDEAIAHEARVWRQRDQVAITEKTDESKRAEYRARKNLRKVVDDAARHS